MRCLLVMVGALAALSAFAAPAPVVIEQTAVSAVQIYSVNDLEIVSESKGTEAASFSAYLVVTAEGNLCTADFMQAKVSYDNASSAEVRKYNVGLEAVEKADFNKQVVGCTADGEITQVKIPLVVNDIPMPRTLSVQYAIPFAEIAGGASGTAVLTVTRSAGGQWKVAKSKFQAAGF